MAHSSHHMILQMKLWLACFSLCAERFLLSFHWLILWIAAFFGIALFNFSGNLLSVIFWIGASALFCLGIKLFKIPISDEIQEKLERRSSISHRPLRSQEDKPSRKLTAKNETLWLWERARKLGQFKLFKWISPDFSLTQRDPYALRILLTLILIVGFVVSGPATPSKILGLVFPFSSSIEKSSGDALKVVITPPPYTRQPQLILSGSPKEPLHVPAGSKVRVLLQSWVGHAELVMQEKRVPLSRDGKTDAYIAETEIPETDSIKLRQFGLPRLNIPVKYIRDNPPTLSLREQPRVVAGGQLLLPLTVSDDYGLKLIRVRAILSTEIKSIPLGQPVYEEQSVVLSLDGKASDINPRFDLTGHPWAGYPVSLLVEAEDYAEQTSTTEPVDIVLPERKFRHPVAQEIIAARKNLIKNGEVAAGAVAMEIVQSLARPARYDWDTVVTLALRSSLSRLGYDPTRASCESVIGTLWQTSLRLEDGNLTGTQSDLRKALENLQRAVQENRSPEEIAQLMQEFRDALSRHLQALQKEMARKEAQGELMPMSPEQMVQMIDPSMLADFLSQLENELMSGNADAAMQKLENLQKLTDMLNPAMAQPMPEDIKQAMKNLKDMQKLVDSQQALLDQTRSKKDQNSEIEKQEQSRIKEELSKTADEMKSQGAKIPESVDKAQDAMGKSESELQGNDPAGSIPHQQEALDQLRQGKQEMQQALKERMQNMMGMSFNPTGQPRDPLGRNSPNNGRDMFNDTVKIPTGSERKKSDEILKTIRERSSDLTRPQAERDYYQRLLRQW